jgi:DNA-binding transcriptional LysR family regulator
MNLKHLETFHYFCKYLSVTKTAEHLHISQPAVSQQLKTFRDECGTTLFRREAGRYVLTETGEAIFLISKVIFSRVEQIEELLSKSRQATAERLWIGSTKAYARTIMPDLIADFQKSFPKAQIRLSEGNSTALLQRLRERKEDVVVVARRDYDAALRATPFAIAEFVLVAKPDHPLANRGEVSMRSLTGESLIIREKGSGSREAILKKLEEHGASPSVVVESESLSFIIAYIGRRMAVSFILSHEAEEFLSKGILKQITLSEGNVRFGADLVTRRDEPMSMPVRQFLQMVRRRFPTSVGN